MLPPRRATASAATATTGATATTTAVATVTATAATVVAAVAVALRGGSIEVGQVSAGVALGHDLALVDPALDTDAPERRARLVEAVVDVRTHRVQRHATVGVAFGAGHLGAAETSGDLHLHALCAGAHRARQRALHRPPEGDPVLQLLGDRPVSYTHLRAH